MGSDLNIEFTDFPCGMGRSETKGGGREPRGINPGWLMFGIQIFEMFFHPATVGVLNQLQVSQLIHANFKQLFGGNFMVKMDKPVATSRQNHHRLASALQKTAFSWSRTAFFYIR